MFLLRIFRIIHVAHVSTLFVKKISDKGKKCING